MLNLTQVRTGTLQESQYVKPYRMHYVQNGVEKTWDLVKSHGSVSVIIYNETKNCLVCVKQFRPGVYLTSIPEEDRRTEFIDTDKYPATLGVTVEFCAGIIDKEKSLELIAAEEVLEECGYKVEPNKLEKIQTFRCSVGTSGEFQTMYYTVVDESMKVASGGGIGDELIEVVDISLEEGRQLLSSPSPTAPAEFLYGLLWFYHNKVPNIEKKINGAVP